MSSTIKHKFTIFLLNMFSVRPFDLNPAISYFIILKCIIGLDLILTLIIRQLAVHADTAKSYMIDSKWCQLQLLLVKHLGHNFNEMSMRNNHFYFQRTIVFFVVESLLLQKCGVSVVGCFHDALHAC